MTPPHRTTTYRRRKAAGEPMGPPGRKASAERRVNVTITVPPAFKTALQRVARARGVTVTALIHEVMRPVVEGGEG